MNQRGEIATATIIIIAAGALIVGLLTGSNINPLSFFQKTASNKKASFSKQTEISTPVILKDGSGRAIAVGTKVENYYDTGMEDGTPILTYGQRIAKFFAGLTNLTLLIILACLILFPGATLLAMRNWGMKYYNTLKTTVKGIKEAPREAQDQVKSSLAVTMDKKHKVVIDEIKKDLN